MASLITSFVALFLLGTATAADVPPPVSLTDLLNSPVTYLGHEIAVSGRVHDVYNSYVFTLEEVRPFYDGRDVVVAVQSPQAIAVGGTDVTVTGIVQPFLRGELESEFDLTGLPSDVLERWERRPVMFARSVRTRRGLELVAPPANLQ
jgi:hypothetical protein